MRGVARNVEAFLSLKRFIIKEMARKFPASLLMESCVTIVLPM